MHLSVGKEILDYRNCHGNTFAKALQLNLVFGDSFSMMLKPCGCLKREEASAFLEHVL